MLCIFVEESLCCAMDRVLLTCSKGAESVVSAEAARKLGATGVRAYTGKVTCEVVDPQ